MATISPSSHCLKLKGVASGIGALPFIPKLGDDERVDYVNPLPIGMSAVYHRLPRQLLS